MAERFTATTDTTQGVPGFFLEEVFAPGSIYGTIQDTNDRRDYMFSPMDAMEQLRTGNRSMGLVPFYEMFDEQGNIRNLDVTSANPDPYGYRDLLAALNFGAVTSKEGGRSRKRRDDRFDPNTGDPVLDEAIRQYGQESEGRGKSTQSPYGPTIYDGPVRRKRTRRKGTFYDYDRAFVNTQDLIDADIRTLNDLDNWARENYGVDAITLAASSPELLAARRQAYEDPSQFFQDGVPVAGFSVPGLMDADVQARLASAQERLAAYRQQAAADRARFSEGRLGALAQQDPSLMRTALGQSLMGQLGATAAGQQYAQQYQPTAMDFDYGLMQAMRPYLRDLELAQMRYGG